MPHILEKCIHNLGPVKVVPHIAVVALGIGQDTAGILDYSKTHTGSRSSIKAHSLYIVQSHNTCVWQQVVDNAAHILQLFLCLVIDNFRNSTQRKKCRQKYDKEKSYQLYREDLCKKGFIFLHRSV